jgi:hypothetical protein
MEAFVAALVRSLVWQGGLDKSCIGVITPFREQVKVLAFFFSHSAVFIRFPFSTVLEGAVRKGAGCQCRLQHD